MRAAKTRVVPFGKIKEGMHFRHRYRISSRVYQAFLDAFGDFNPTHVDDDSARKAGFPEKFIHGAIYNGFISHFEGMVFPGPGAILLSSDLRYLKPSFLNDILVLNGEVIQKNMSRGVIKLKVEFKNVTRSYIAARGMLLIMVRDIK